MGSVSLTNQQVYSISDPDWATGMAQILVDWCEYI